MNSLLAPITLGPNAFVGQTLDVVVFHVDQTRIDVEASQVRACRSMDPGYASDTEFGVEALLGLDQSGGGVARQWLVIKGDMQDHAVHVSGPVELLELPTEAIYPLPPLLAARTSLRHLRALSWIRGGIHLVVDIRAALAERSGVTQDR